MAEGVLAKEGQEKIEDDPVFRLIRKVFPDEWPVFWPELLGSSRLSPEVLVEESLSAARKQGKEEKVGALLEKVSLAEWYAVVGMLILGMVPEGSNLSQAFFMVKIIGTSFFLGEVPVRAHLSHLFAGRIVAARAKAEALRTALNEKVANKPDELTLKS